MHAASRTPLAVVIMAAGKGTRMKNPDIAKVMFPVGEKPMVEHVADLAKMLHAARTVVIVGWQKDSVIRHLAAATPGVRCVEQFPQLGTGHAIMQAGPALADFEGNVLVLSGDVPLLRGDTVRSLLHVHEEEKASATVLTTLLDDPTGYGRVVRDAHRKVIAIVEQKDASDEQKTIREVNSGIYVFDKGKLFDALKHITPDNAQGEYYLTDVFGYFWKLGLPVSAVASDDPLEVRGVNNLEQLEEARRVLAGRASG